MLEGNRLLQPITTYSDFSKPTDEDVERSRKQLLCFLATKQGIVSSGRRPGGGTFIPVRLASYCKICTEYNHLVVSRPHFIPTPQLMYSTTQHSFEHPHKRFQQSLKESLDKRTSYGLSSRLALASKPYVFFRCGGQFSSKPPKIDILKALQTHPLEERWAFPFGRRRVESLITTHLIGLEFGE